MAKMQVEFSKFVIDVEVEDESTWTFDELFEQIREHFKAEAKRLETATGRDRWPLGVVVGADGNAVRLAMLNFDRTYRSSFPLSL
jgi:hypothetical protein